MSVNAPLDVQRFGNSSNRDSVNTYTSAFRAFSGTPKALSSITTRDGSAFPANDARYRPLALVRSSTADKSSGRDVAISGSSVWRAGPASSPGSGVFAAGSVRR
jgi:hypothetical protein